MPGWLSQGQGVFKPPQYSFLINTLSGTYVRRRKTGPRPAVPKESLTASPCLSSAPTDLLAQPGNGKCTYACPCMHAHVTDTHALPPSHPIQSNPPLGGAAIATHRLQFLPMIAATLGGLLQARFLPQQQQDAAAAAATGHE